jgi:hypothetical protein
LKDVFDVVFAIVLSDASLDWHLKADRRAAGNGAGGPANGAGKGDSRLRRVGRSARYSDSSGVHLSVEEERGNVGMLECCNVGMVEWWNGGMLE